jgi:hypothetical protein
MLFTQHLLFGLLSPYHFDLYFLCCFLAASLDYPTLVTKNQKRNFVASSERWCRIFWKRSSECNWINNREEAMAVFEVES